MNVLLVGATGYTGRRLAMKLLPEQDVNLRILVKDRRRVNESLLWSVDIIEGDYFDESVLRKAVDGMDVVYYPLRLFGAIMDFTDFDRMYVHRFRDICIESGVGKIVYISFPWAGRVTNKILENMQAAGEILSACPEKIQCIWLRTGALIGAGSVVFEIVKNLIEKAPVIFMPTWMRKNIYVNGVDDVLEYLTQARSLPRGENRVVDTFRMRMTLGEMLREAAREMGKHRVFIPIPLTSCRISAFFMMLRTPFSYPLALLLIRTFQSGEITPQASANEDALQCFPSVKPGSFARAFGRALEETRRKEVMSRWIDSMENISFASPEEDMAKAVYHDVRQESFAGTSPERIFRALKSIGGESGWFTFDFLWRLRGMLDKLMGGYGTSIGRRADEDLRVGDTLDVWKVVHIEENKVLLLEAQMKVAGKAWLEFIITGDTLIQTAYYYPHGIIGKLYWYSVSPFHFFVFRDLIKNIIKQAKETA